MTKLKTSLTETLLMFMMPNLVSLLEHGLVFIKINFRARHAKLIVLLSTPADHSQFSVSTVQLHRGLRKICLFQKKFLSFIHIILPIILNKFCIQVMCYIFGALFKCVYHTSQKQLYMVTKICGHGRGVGGTGLMWVNHCSFIFEFERGNFELSNFCVFFTT